MGIERERISRTVKPKVPAVGVLVVSGDRVYCQKKWWLSYVHCDGSGAGSGKVLGEPDGGILSDEVANLIIERLIFSEGIREF